MTRYEFGLLLMIILIAPHLGEGAALLLGLIHLAIGFLLDRFERKDNK